LKREVFLDSGIFVAFLDRSDRFHQEAKALFAGARRRWSTSLLVISETYSWFLHRLGEEPARHFTMFLTQLPDLEFFEATCAHHRLTLRVLDRLRGTKLTYVDASSLAFIDTYRIPAVWSTDRHLALTGSLVTPGGD
jgi:predicted nucleic acid-binding protein